ncbi:MAG TPA: NAD-dependent epimerase/dehydratase family protein [Terrimicrobiaceae bacterium]
MPRVIIVGCGFLGEAAADLFFQSGWNVLGICAGAESARRLAPKPYEVRAVDITATFSLAAPWRNADALVHCAAPDRADADKYRLVYFEGLKNALLGVQPHRVLFTGSTSVYAQTDGQWVDEASETTPTRETGRILLEAEAAALAAGGFVARLSGLYGPGRSVLMQKFLSGEATIEGDGQRWINQIHRDDAARAIIHLLTKPVAAGVYNVSDNTPANQLTVYRWLADHFGRALPGEGQLDLNRKRGWTSKRVSNLKLRQAGWIPAFPAYRDAISSLGAGCICP